VWEAAAFELRQALAFYDEWDTEIAGDKASATLWPLWLRGVR